MKLTRFVSVLVLSVALCSGWTHADEATGDGLYQDPVPPTYGSSVPLDLLNTILSPITTTLKHASNFLGNRMGNVYDGIDAVQRESFKMFMSVYNKTYSAEELPRRMALFFQRRKLIQDSINAFREGRLPFTMRENSFIDWDDQELKALTGVSLPDMSELEPEEQMNLMQADNVVPPSNQAPSRRRRSTNETTDEDEMDDANMIVKAERIPATRDWRDSGCIAPVINQEKCGACYAIASMSVVESMRCLQIESGPTLAPQQVVDCATVSKGYSNYGCDGGWPTRALKYLQDSGVAAREVCYPFVRRQNACKIRAVTSKSGCFVSSSPTNTRLNFKVLNNERDILYHVAKTGPVATVMKASDRFLYYGSGIFDDPSCSRRRNDVDHAIVIVGYGRENGQDYWLIKNSWGRGWGINGYGKYKRGTNACSIGHWGWVLTS